MNVLITGINGFIGSRYAARVKAEGNMRVIGLDIQPTARCPDCDEYIQIDLGAADAAIKLRRYPKWDRLLHAGGISGFMVETDNPRRIFDVNVAGTMALLETARSTGAGRLVLCSTLMVYAPDDRSGPAHDEIEYPRPISVYGASKLANEALMHAFVAQYGADAVALRFSHVYGPGRTTECFIREMLAAAAAGRPCSIPQASGSLRQFVHIDDVCDSIALAMEATDLSCRIFNISADEIHTLAGAAEVVRQVAGRLDVCFDETRDLPNYRIGKLSIRRAQQQLGYRPRLTLQAGVLDYWTTAFLPHSSASY
jgi:nucleoside-diphosphate-sugar epimerase